MIKQLTNLNFNGIKYLIQTEIISISFYVSGLRNFYFKCNKSKYEPTVKIFVTQQAYSFNVFKRV